MHRVTPGAGQGGIGNAHIARGGVQQGFLGRELARSLSRLEDGQGRAVFDGAAGIEPLRFGVDLHRRRQMPGDVLQPDEGRMAHQIVKRVGSRSVPAQPAPVDAGQWMCESVNRHQKSFVQALANKKDSRPPQRGKAAAWYVRLSIALMGSRRIQGRQATAFALHNTCRPPC